MRLELIPAIHRATHRIGLYLAELREDGLSQGEAHVLAQLAGAGPTTIRELHHGLAHKRSTLTSILDRLVERELVTRETGTSDRRTFVIALTTKGGVVARRVQRHLAELERSIKQKFSANQMQAFLRVISAVEEHAHRRTASGRAERSAREG